MAQIIRGELSCQELERIDPLHILSLMNAIIKMGSTFERIHQSDPVRESDVSRENLSIALSDQEYLQRIRQERHALDIALTSTESNVKVEKKSSKRKSKKVTIS